MGEQPNTATLRGMILEGKFDDLTDHECYWLCVEVEYDWVDYCRFVEPRCTHHFFLYGCEEE